MGRAQFINSFILIYSAQRGKKKITRHLFLYNAHAKYFVRTVNSATTLTPFATKTKQRIHFHLIIKSLREKQKNIKLFQKLWRTFLATIRKIKNQATLERTLEFFKFGSFHAFTLS